MYKAKLWGQCSSYLSLFSWELSRQKLAIDQEINIPLSGRRRDRQKDNHNLQKTFPHLTTDIFSLKSGVGKLTTLKFSLLLFVAYFFSI